LPGFVLQRYLLVWLIFSSSISYIWPAQWSHEVDFFDPFKAPTTVMISWLIGITMFVTGMMLPRDEIRQVIRGWPVVVGGTVVQFATMPKCKMQNAK